MSDAKEKDKPEAKKPEVKLSEPKKPDPKPPEGPPDTPHAAEPPVAAPVAAPAEPMKRKLERVRSTNRLIELLKEHGCHGKAIEVCEGVLPRDKFGDIPVDADAPVELALEKLQEVADIDEEDLNVPAVSQYTVQRARAIAATGTWVMPTKYEPKRAIRFASEDLSGEEPAAPAEETAEELKKKKKAAAEARPKSRVSRLGMGV